jgi:hypothetical protein
MFYAPQPARQAGNRLKTLLAALVVSAAATTTDRPLLAVVSVVSAVLPREQVPQALVPLLVVSKQVGTREITLIRLGPVE